MNGCESIFKLGKPKFYFLIYLFWLEEPLVTGFFWIAGKNKVSENTPIFSEPLSLAEIASDVV